MKKSSIPSFFKKFLSVHFLSTILFIFVLSIDMKYFPNSSRFVEYKKTLKLSDLGRAKDGGIDFSFNLPNTASNIMVIGQFKNTSNTVFYATAAISCLHNGEIAYFRSYTFKYSSEENHKKYIQPKIVNFDRVDVSVKVDNEYPQSDIEFELIVRTDSAFFVQRQVFVRSVYFVSSLIFFIIFLGMKTSQFRGIAGIVMSVYSAIVCCPFTEFFHNFYIDCVHIIGILCLSCIVLFYSVIVKERYTFLDIIVALVISVLIFCCEAIYVASFLSHEYDTPTQEVSPNVEKYDYLFKIALGVMMLYGTVSRIIRDRDYRNYFLMIISFIQCYCFFKGCAVSTATPMYTIGIGLMHVFIYAFPTQVRKSPNQSKKLKKGPGKVKIQELAPVKQTKKPIKKKSTTSDTESSEDTDYSYEDESSDDSYESTYDDEYEDDATYESSSEEKPKKKKSKRRDSSDYDDDDDDDDDDDSETSD